MSPAPVPFCLGAQIQTSTQSAVTVMNEAPSKSSISPIGWFAILIGMAGLGFLIYYNIAHLHDGHGGGHADAHAPAFWGLGVLPFAALLGCIAVLPLIPATHHWWESNLNRLIVALTCGGLSLAYYVIVKGWPSVLPTLNHAVPAEYVPFIVLLFSLYVISGGISLKGDLAAHPAVNTSFLAFGALIASFIGTTGASMLLIRPLLQTNGERKHKVHTVVFFIFLVSNIGGCLLPIGDPPLFLGYLRGVAFFWTFNLWLQWAACCAILLVVYFVVDTIAYRKEDAKDIQLDETQTQPMKLRGTINILWLAGIVACVATVNHETTLIKAELTPTTTIAQLNGSRGASMGTIYITDSAHHTAAIDLAHAASIGDVCDLINASEGVGVTAAIDDGHLLLADTAGGDGALAAKDKPPHDEHAETEAETESEGSHDAPLHGTAARDLGIAVPSEGGTLTGKEIVPGWTPFPFLREVLMFVLVGLSLITTPRGIREDNDFNYAAILEVAALFIGIFIAMQVPIEVLRVFGPDLGLTDPWHFFWATGSLSSLLDNAPTYVVFFETARSFDPEPFATTIIREPLLIGISLGAVFMGAMTYIGNGPNFMVKAIAEQAGVRMPSFFGYMFKYSIVYLVPVFVLVTVFLLPGGDNAVDDLDTADETPPAHVEPEPAYDEPEH